MTDTRAQEIAAGLTKAQREAVMGALCTADGRVLVDAAPVHGGGPWPEGMTRYYSYKLDCLTSLGEEVRHILMEQEHGE